MPLPVHWSAKGDSMTIWVERTVDVQEWERIQSLFEEHFSGLKGPHEMILVEVDTGHAGLVRLVAGLPDGTPISTYEGFVEIGDNELPKTANLLVGHVERFHEHFSYPTARR
jgi:hypothetical protein